MDCGLWTEQNGDFFVVCLSKRSPPLRWFERMGQMVFDFEDIPRNELINIETTPKLLVDEELKRKSKVEAASQFIQI